MTAQEDLRELLANLPGYSTLTDAQIQRALDGARIPDSAGVWPGGEGYVPTYDIFYAALNLLPWLASQPVIRQTSSEGTSLAVDAPNWQGLASYFREQSIICQATSTGILNVVEIPQLPHVRKVDMSAKGDAYYGNVDTDLG